MRLLESRIVREELDLLLRLHDGDDRCGCLRSAFLAAIDGCLEDAVAIIRDCLESHPAGSSYYRKG